MLFINLVINLTIFNIKSEQAFKLWLRRWEKWRRWRRVRIRRLVCISCIDTGTQQTKSWALYCPWWIQMNVIVCNWWHEAWQRWRVARWRRCLTFISWQWSVCDYSVKRTKSINCLIFLKKNCQFKCLGKQIYTLSKVYGAYKIDKKNRLHR